MAQSSERTRKTGGGWLVALVQLAVMAALTAVVIPSITPGAAVHGDLRIKVLYLGRIVLLLAVATVLMRLSGRRWPDVGLRRPAWPRFLLAIPLGFVGCIVLAGAAGQILARSGFHQTADYSMFAPVRGNPNLYLFVLIPVTWGTAAFGEEMLFRGFFLDGLRRLLGSEGPIATTLAVVAQAVVFGLLHLYQGPAGAASAGAIGLALGFVWWFSGRNLWAGIVLHGIIDSLAMTAIYLGVMPTR
jgi:membrane protease YdiL (CAAX protease family)